MEGRLGNISALFVTQDIVSLLALLVWQTGLSRHNIYDLTLKYRT